MAPSSPQTLRSGTGQGAGTGHPGIAGAACLEATGLSVHMERRRCQQAHRLWDPMPIRATFLGCSLPVVDAPDSSPFWELRWIDQMLPSLF